MTPFRSWRYLVALLLLAASMGAAARNASTGVPALAKPATPVPYVYEAGTIVSGIVSPEPAGAWVTSTWPTTHYYCSRDQEGVWLYWAPANRVWFATEAELLAMYPGRERKD